MNPELRKKWLIAAAVAVCGLFVADRFVLSPLAAVWSERSDRIADLRAELEDARALVARHGELKQRWTEMVEASLPASQGDAEGLVLDAVNEWATEAGLEMSAIKPRWDQDSDPPTLECTASGAGTMAAIARFLHALETGPASLRVDEVGLSAEDETGSRLRMDLRFTGVVLKGGAT